MAGPAGPSATPQPGFQWSCGSAFSQLLRNLSSRMAEGTGTALHVPAALPVSHGPERLPEQSGWHRPPPGPPLGAFGPSPSPEHCRGLSTHHLPAPLAMLSREHHLGNRGAETRRSHCTPVGHHQDVDAAVLATLLGWRVSDGQGQAARPLINIGTQGHSAAASLGCRVYGPPGRCPPG